MPIRADLVIMLILGSGMLARVPASQAADDGADRAFSGKVAAAIRFDDNITLANGKQPDQPVKADFLDEITLKGSYHSSGLGNWQSEANIFGILDYAPTYPENTSYGGKGDAYLEYHRGANSLCITEEARYYHEPEADHLHFLRNFSMLAGKRTFSDFWQGRIGYENIANIATQSDSSSYYANGAFLELRQSWSLDIFTYAIYDFQYYSEHHLHDPQRPDVPGGPRHTLEFGLDALFLTKQSILFSYTFQDDSRLAAATGASADDGMHIPPPPGHGLGGHQPGPPGHFRGETESLENEDEANFRKHKLVLLYSYFFHPRLTFSLYGEAILKTFVSPKTMTMEQPRERIDHLLLTSGMLDIRLTPSLYLTGHYAYRMNDSTIPEMNFKNHIASLGIGYHF
jgi:hypothetical protein